MTDLRRLDFMLLLVLREGVRRRKLTDVADALGVTQAAVSHAVGRLRTLFGDPLFLRRPHGVEPTARAVALADAAALVLDAGAAMLRPPGPFAPAGLRRTLRIAALDYDALLASDAVAALAAEAPEARFTFRALGGQEAARALAEGTVDAAMGLLRDPPPEIRRRTLLTETYLTVARADHPRVARALDLDAFCAEGHVLAAPGGTARGVVDHALEAVGRRRRVAVATAGFLHALTVVAASDMIATVPRRLALAQEARFGLVAHAPPVAVRPFPVSLAWHARSDADAAVRWMLDGIARGVAGTT